ARIASRLAHDRERLTGQWQGATPVRHFIVDDLLPPNDVAELAAAMPDPATLVLKDSWRERKRVGVQVRDYHPAVGAHLFASPHLDNSHDGDQRRYRVLNLLFYVSPDWALENGGNLELWDRRIKTPATVHSRFNRLVVMETTPGSWHSVSRVTVDAPRVCISNY